MPKTDNSTFPTRDQLRTDVDLKALADLSGRQLCAMLEAINTLTEVVVGLSCQPRFNDEKGWLTAPGHELSRISEWLSYYADAIVQSARERESEDAGDSFYCLQTIASAELRAARDYPTLMRAVSDAMLKQAKTERRLFDQKAVA